MRTYLDCYPCFLRQALSAARFSGADESAQLQIVDATLKLLREIPSHANPPQIADQVHRIVREVLDAEDPYLQVKESSTRAALDLYPWLVGLVAHSSDPVETAIRIAIAGNIIDYGASDSVADLRTTVLEVLDAPIEPYDLAGLRTALARAPWVLYLADNAGETVFDRVLIETLRVPVTYVVKGGPALNDATRADAVAAGLESCARVIDSGVDAPGTDPERSSREFRKALETAPVVLAKGQANYESLSDAGERVFHLLRVKCAVIAQDLGLPVGSVVVHRARDRPPHSSRSAGPVERFLEQRDDPAHVQRPPHSEDAWTDQSS